MSKTWFNHKIIPIKGTDYVELKDYVELQNKLFDIIKYTDFTSDLIFKDKYVGFFVKDVMKHIKDLAMSSEEKDEQNRV